MGDPEAIEVTISSEKRCGIDNLTDEMQEKQEAIQRTIRWLSKLIGITFFLYIIYSFGFLDHFLKP